MTQELTVQSNISDENSIIANGKSISVFEGMRVKNFLNADIVRFKNQSRKPGNVKEYIQHETVTASWKTTQAVLIKRKLGVQFIIDPDGIIYQHGDIETDLQYHASSHNGVCVGCELVNPYYPKYIPKSGSPWKTIIDAPWAHEGKYVVPTIESLEANYLLTEWLLSAYSGLQIPRKWNMIKGNKMILGRIAGADKPSSGILSHLNFGHADGGFPILYTWLRSERGLSSEHAMQESIRLSTGAKGFVDLSYYSSANDVP